MSYELHITRRKNWFDQENISIDFEEWQSFVASESELQIVGFAETTLPDGNILSLERKGLTKWTGHPNLQTAWLIWRNGNISCKNPDAFLLAKMIQIASRLQARVQGDEGEFYS